ncbi:Six-hairpin glycosidase-like protein [Paraphysoderma sedebokerense]|nr:Six-hairpin glycosidase-like protein [Paraphysoderma sedebokerense]
MILPQITVTNPSPGVQNTEKVVRNGPLTKDPEELGYFETQDTVTDEKNFVGYPEHGKRVHGYLPIDSYGIIGNLRTVALVGVDASIDYFCYPKFDSPSIFCRLLDKNIGGHFQIAPTSSTSVKQQYLPNSNVLVTRFLAEEGAGQVTDFMPLPDEKMEAPTTAHPVFGRSFHHNMTFPWLIRMAEVVRGKLKFRIECFPAFNYARSSHVAEVRPTNAQTPLSSAAPVHFISSDHISLDLRFLVACGNETPAACPLVQFHIVHREGMTGPGVIAEVELQEGQQIWFVLREKGGYSISVDNQTTLKFWHRWLSQSSYKGRWRETVQRSALTLKLLTYEPTGAVVASPTFSLPEDIGGNRNWDYRYVWVRDSAFTIYALIRLGLIQEARNYMIFIERICNDMSPEGSLQVMYTIDGHKEMPEMELDHLEGYRCSKPVRIGNGAYTHLQMDIYGALMDSIYLMNKFSSPIGYDMWVACRKLVNYVCRNWRQADMSIWEVRGPMQNFTYSKVMCWVAVDRGIRLSEKRILPLPDRDLWLTTRDEIYEEVMSNSFRANCKYFVQSYENQVLDSSVLIMPLVFFISPTDPRLMNTIAAILKPLEKGGLTANNLVYRYNVEEIDDGLNTGEGSFTMCTFWLIEALTRAGKYNRSLLEKAIYVFEQVLGYGNHLSLFSEEIAKSGEALGNFPQAFTHIALISSAFNLDRVLECKPDEQD